MGVGTNGSLMMRKGEIEAVNQPRLETYSSSQLMKTTTRLKTLALQKQYKKLTHLM